MRSTPIIRTAAVAILGLILTALALLWPLPDLGFATDLSGAVLLVTPDSPAARGGLQAGDHITQIYAIPWSDLGQRLLIMPLPWHVDTPTPIVVQRGATNVRLTLTSGMPTLWEHLATLPPFLVALACWSTGIFLARSPRAIDRRLQGIAWFWLILAAVLGLFPLAQTASYVGCLALFWFSTTILAPLAAVVHVWYPSRPIYPTTQRRAWQGLFIAWGSLQLLVGGLWIAAPSKLVLLEWLNLATIVGFLGSCIVSGLILRHAYRHTTIAHIRRQIRLIIVACLLVASGWAMLVLITTAIPALVPWMPTWSYTVITIVIPLAYLIGGVSADLMRIDQIARRVLGHTTASVLVVAVVTIGVKTIPITVPPALLLAIMLISYPPTSRLSRRLVQWGYRDLPPDSRLQHTIAQFGTSLETRQLVAWIGDGLRDAFHSPPLAIYARLDHTNPALTLTDGHTPGIPETIILTAIESLLPQAELLWPAAAIQQHLGPDAPDPVLVQLAFHPAFTLWGLIRHAQGAILGLVVLGPRGDQDPYRAVDRHALQLLLGAASLAVTNSASYAEQIQARQIMRQLYRNAQEAQELTAAKIAREIHDEVLNVNMRLNIEAVRKLLSQVQDVLVREELLAILDAEVTAGDMLRLICEQLQPTRSDEPFGLPASLRRQMIKTGATWPGKMQFTATGTPIPITSAVQREVVRITRESLVNAIKHADATAIVVTLRFPEQPGAPLELTILDNGTTRAPIVPRPSHWGLHYMRESAATIGATLTWSHPEDGGTIVRITTLAQPETANEALLPAWVMSLAAD